MGKLRVWFGTQETVMEEQSWMMAKKCVSWKRVLCIYRTLLAAQKE